MNPHVFIFNCKYTSGNGNSKNYATNNGNVLEMELLDPRKGGNGNYVKIKN